MCAHFQQRLSKLEDEFKFQEDWLKVLLLGKFLLQDVPDEIIIQIFTKLNTRSFVRLLQSCKWIYLLVKERKGEYTIFTDYTIPCSFRKPENLKIFTGYRFILKQNNFTEEGIRFHYLETSDCRKFLNTCRNKLARTVIENKGPSEIEPRHLAGFTCDKYFLYKTFEKFLRAKMPETIDCQIHIDTFISTLDDYISTKLLLLPLTQEFYFEIGVSKSRFVMPPFEILAIETRRQKRNNLRRQRRNNQVVEFSLFLYPSMVGFHGDIAAVNYAFYPRLVYFMSYSSILTEEELNNFYVQIQNQRQEPKENKSLIMEMVKERFFKISPLPYGYRSRKSIGKYFLKNLKDFRNYPPPSDPMSFENGQKMERKLPQLCRAMPINDRDMDKMYLNKLEESIKGRRKWLSILQRGKFILDVLPVNCVLEVIKKMDINEFVRMYRTTKWINEIIQMKRSTFLKDTRKMKYSYSLKNSISFDYNTQKHDFENISEYVNARKYFLLSYISFSSYTENVEAMKKILEHLRCPKKWTDTVTLTGSPLISELFEISQMKKLVIYSYKIGSTSVAAFPQTLEKISIRLGSDEVGKEALIDFLKYIPPFKGEISISNYFIDNEGLSEQIKFILLKIRRNYLLGKVTLEVQFRRGDVYSFENAFPNSTEAFKYKRSIKYKVKLNGKLVSQIPWEYGIFIEKLAEGVIVVAISRLKVEDDKYQNWVVDLFFKVIESIDELRPLFEETIITFFKSMGRRNYSVEKDGKKVNIQKEEFMDNEIYEEIEKKFFTTPSQEEDPSKFTYS